MADFDDIINLYYDKLYCFALSLAKNQDDAADLTQEAFRRWAAKGQHQVNNEVKIKSWLFTTLYRLFIDQQRRNKKFHRDDVEAHLAYLPVSENITHKLDATIAMEALIKLDEKYRAVLALYYIESYSYNEISEVLGIPKGTVMSRLSRGKAILYSMLTVKKNDNHQR